jgi:hypothetical protein
LANPIPFFLTGGNYVDENLGKVEKMLNEGAAFIDVERIRANPMNMFRKVWKSSNV